MAKKNNVISLPHMVSGLAMMNLSKEVDDLKAAQKEICEMSVRALLKALECKDDYTFGHSMRVAFYSLELGREYGLNEDELYNLELAALFHDIGKIGVPDNVLLKPARLEEDEFLKMKKHPELSAEILEGFTHFKDAAKFAKHHHERYDGRGYPDGLAGRDIPFYSRVILIADTFDAMTSTRPYRKGLPFEVAFEELREFAGTQFDPDLVEYFIRAMQKDQTKSNPSFSLEIIKGDFKKEAA